MRDERSPSCLRVSTQRICAVATSTHTEGLVHNYFVEGRWFHGVAIGSCVRVEKVVATQGGVGP